jgi:hypothetical protein
MRESDIRRARNGLPTPAGRAADRHPPTTSRPDAVPWCDFTDLPAEGCQHCKEIEMADQAALNAAYRERAHLVALLAAQYPSHVGHNDPTAPEWAVVTVEAPGGQLCWHISPDDMDLFEHVQQTNRICRGWDGHTTEEKYQRIRDLTAVVQPLPIDWEQRRIVGHGTGSKLGILGPTAT